jgi:hypothetical protein
MSYEPDVIVVIGDPGVGKTTLLNGMANYGGEAGSDEDLFEGVTAWKDVQLKNGPKLKGGVVLRVIDTPGLGGPKGKLTDWLVNLLDILKKQMKHIAGIVIMVDGITPRITMSSHIMTQVVPALLNPSGNPWDRMVLVVSKCNQPNSIYQKKDPATVRNKLVNGLKVAKVPKLEKFNSDRDIVFAGNKGEAPDYNEVLDRLNVMVGDKKQPQMVTDKSQAVDVVANALAEAVGTMIDGKPVAAVANNMIEDVMASSYQSCPGCGGC